MAFSQHYKSCALFCSEVGVRGPFFTFTLGFQNVFINAFVFLLQIACKLSLPRIPPTPVHPCHKVVLLIHFSSQQILCSESDELRVPVSSATVMWGDSYRLMRAHSILVETTAATTAMPQMQKMVIGCHITGSRWENDSIHVCMHYSR